MKKKHLTMACTFILLISLFGAWLLFPSPSKAVNLYLSECSQTNKSNGSEEIRSFLRYHETHNLPRPSVTLKTIEKTASSRNILANFEIIQYGEDNRVQNVYTGKLYFSLIRKPFSWNIGSVEVIQPMTR